MPRSKNGAAGLATDRFNDQETGIALIGDTPDFGTSLGIASYTTLMIRIVETLRRICQA